MIHINCYNKYYTINFYEDYIEINIINIPSNNYERAKIYFDIILYFQIDAIVKYNNKIFNDEYELKKFFKIYKNYKN